MTAIEKIKARNLEVITEPVKTIRGQFYLIYNTEKKYNVGSVDADCYEEAVKQVLKNIGETA